MEQLSSLIAELEASELDPRPYLHDEDHPNVRIICILLETVFITPRGNINLDARDEFRETYGYELYAVERDDWGWILGGLRTKKGTITFG